MKWLILSGIPVVNLRFISEMNWEYRNWGFCLSDPESLFVEDIEIILHGPNTTLFLTRKSTVHRKVF